MDKVFRAVALATTMFLCLNLAFLQPTLAATLVGPSWATKAVFYNASNQDVTVLVTVNALDAGKNQQDGCPYGSVGLFRVTDLTSGTGPTSLVTFGNGAATKGWFQLLHGHQVQIYTTGTNPKTGQITYCMQSVNFGFGHNYSACPGVPDMVPNTTPGPKYNQVVSITPPNGSNGAELTINQPGTVGGVVYPVATTGSNPQEVTTVADGVDLTCLAGANSSLTMQLTPPVGGPYWATNLGPAGGGAVTYKVPVTLQNSWVYYHGSSGCDDNCVDPKTGLARPGVYPYGCSQCNKFPDTAPQCSGSSSPDQYCAAKNGLAANNGCLFTRQPLAYVNGAQQFGGTIQVTYVGPLSPPSNACK